ncbi:MAG: hypothetical protein LM567_07660 [Desulfurococcaceae archaeon]|nr:hypothetical protein [Desulfurococcaceae archaeon]
MRYKYFSPLLKLLLELSPGLLLLTLTLLVIYTRKIEISILPLLAILLSFLTASIIAKKSLPRTLRKIYSWRHYETLSPLLLIPPLILLLQSGYTYYDLWYANTLLQLIISFTCGLAIFFITYPVLRRL